MKPKIKTARRKASKLHGATAQYVSVVDRGANETPFTMIKSANGASAMGIKPRKKISSKKSHKTVNSGQKKTETVKSVRTETMMAKMVFSSAQFETEQDVADWIAKAEWDAEDIEILKNEEGDLVARPNGLEDDDFEKLGEVDAEEEGVTAFVGERKVDDSADDASVTTLNKDDEAGDETDDVADAEDAPSDDDEDVESGTSPHGENADGLLLSQDSKKKPVKKLSKRATFLKKRATARSKEQKFDSWDAHFSKGNTLAEVLKDGMKYDGVPPGYYEVQAAFNSAIGNIVSSDGDDKQGNLNTVSLQFAEIIGGLDTFFDSYVESGEDTIAKSVETDEVRDMLAKWAEDYADFVESLADQAAALTKKTTPVADLTEAPTIDYSKVSDLVAKAVDPLIEQVSKVSGTVEALASRRPTKKAAGPEDSGQTATDAQKGHRQSGTAFVREKQEKALLG